MPYPDKRTSMARFPGCIPEGVSLTAIDCELLTGCSMGRKDGNLRNQAISIDAQAEAGRLRCDRR
jgi:hypothetical protein